MNQKLENAKALYMEGIRDGHARQAVEKYTGDRYTQHSTGVKDGAAGFIEFFEPFLERNPIRHIEIVRGFTDGQHVFMQAYQSLNNGEYKWVTMDFFDTDANDKIIEHWDVIAEYVGETASGRTQVDGATEITDTGDMATNKALVRAMIEDLLMPNGDLGKADEYIAQDYIQHSVDIADGRDAFVNMLTSLERALWYQEIVLLIGCGDFVATLSRTTVDGQEYAQTDLFRVENGKVVEHWDAAEPVPAAEELANSGKF